MAFSDYDFKKVFLVLAGLLIFFLAIAATITSVYLSKLDDQPFFAKAKVGDKVLLFTQAKKAILYDPIGNVVVEVGPLILPAGASPTPAFDQTESLTLDQDIQGIKTASPTSSLTPTASILKAAVYNGT